jgi:hypothetical protein
MMNKCQSWVGRMGTGVADCGSAVPENEKSSRTLSSD